LMHRPRGWLWLILCALVVWFGTWSGHAWAQNQGRPWLGVVLDKGDAQGVGITDVVAGSPAETVHLAAGDRIVSVDAARVASARDVIGAVGRHQPGEVVSLAFVRAGKSHQVSVTLATMPSGEELLRKQRVNKPAPAFVGLASVDGAAIPTIAGLRGKVVLVEFWAPWCLACRLTTPDLNTWSSQYGPRGLAIVGVGTDEVTAISAGARSWGIRYPIAADPDMKTWTGYGIREAPSMLIIDRRGVVRDVATGYDRVRMREIEALIDRLLREPAP
jgi:thiol-disulfide isomerase/thioredoxin